MNSSESVDTLALRRELYFKSGYFVWRGFCTPQETEHLRRTWFESSDFPWQSAFDKARDIYPNCKNFSRQSGDNLHHYNFFWNEPRDLPTLSLAVRLQVLRNTLEGRPLDQGLNWYHQTPGEKKHYRYTCSYRVIQTKSQGEVRPHCDWARDHSRLQMSLQLSSFGSDYQDGGLVVFDKFRGGNPINLSETLGLEAGDLVIFRYSHEHSVDAVSNHDDGSLGFCRMLLPLEVIDLRENPSTFFAFAKKRCEHWLRTQLYSRGVKLPKVQRTLARSQGPELYYDEDVEDFMKLAIDHGIEPVDVFNFKGLWGRYHLHQDWQKRALLGEGLQPCHSVLDIGCGILRLGIWLVDYLEQHRYFGIDSSEKYLELGTSFLASKGVDRDSFQVALSSKFEFAQFQCNFEFAIAHSVFTHLSFSDIRLCLANLKKVMAQGGKLIFTILHNTDKQRGAFLNTRHPLVKSSHGSLDFYSDLASELNITLAWPESHEHGTQRVGIYQF